MEYLVQRFAVVAALLVFGGIPSAQAAFEYVAPKQPQPVSDASPSQPTSLLPPSVTVESKGDLSQRIVRGMARDIPLADVAKAVVPSEMTVSFDPPALASRKGNFVGSGRSWKTVLDESLAEQGLEAIVSGQAVTIAAPPPQLPPPSTSAQLAKDPLPTPGNALPPPAQTSSTPLATATAPMMLLQTAVPQSAPNMPVPPPIGAPPVAPDFSSVLQVRTWTVEPGSTFSQTVAAWAGQINLPPPDDLTGMTWGVDFPGTFTGTYLEALEWLTGAFSDLPVKPDWKFSRTNLVTLLVLKSSR